VDYGTFHDLFSVMVAEHISHLIRLIPAKEPLSFVLSAKNMTAGRRKEKGRPK